MSRQKPSSRFRFVGAASLTVLLALLVPALRGGDRRLYLLAAGVTGAMLLCMIIPARLFSLDRPILSFALYLGAVGIFSLASADPDAALIQLLRCSVGVVALIIGAMMIRIVTASMLTAGISSFLGLLLIAGGLLVRDAALPFTEAALVLLVIAFASLLSCHGGVTALFPSLAGTALLLLRGMTNEAAVLALAVLFLLWSADGRAVVSIVALIAFAVLFFGAWRLGYLPAFMPAEEHAASLSALADAGLFGTDGAAALPEDPALPGSSLLYGIASHFGLVMTGLTLLLYLPLVLRGASVAGTARTRFHAVLAMGCTLIFALRVPAGLLPAFGVLPLPLSPLPLLTSSLPDLSAQMLTLGLLCGISSVNEADLAEDAHLAMLAK